MTQVTQHIPILLNEIVNRLTENLPTLVRDHDSKNPLYIFDGTLGGGGHTGEILKKISDMKLNSVVKILAIDQDQAHRR